MTGRLFDAFRARVERHPSRTAVVFRRDGRWDAPIDYAGLQRRALSAAARFRREGVEPGARVLIALDTGPAAVAAFLGAVAAGAVPAFTPAWSAASFGGGVAYAGRLERMRRTLDAPWLVLPGAVRASWPGDPVGCLPGEPFEEDPASVPGDRVEDSGEVCCLQATSGTTADPRAVRVTHENVLANREALSAHSRETGRDTMVSWCPWHHDMGLQGALLFPLLSGFPSFHLAPSEFLRRPVDWLREIDRLGATITVAPNSAFARACRALASTRGAAPRLVSLELVFNGSEPIDPRTLRATLDGLAQCGFRRDAMAPCYGLAEATLAVTLTRRGAGPRVDTIDRERLREGRAEDASDAATALDVVSCGSVARGNAVTIVDERGTPLPERHVGEVVVQGASVCAGYLDDEVGTRDAFAPEGLRTGDEGYLSGGELFVVGRRKDVLIVRGRNVSPVELEWAAERVAGVRPGGAVAFSLPDPDEGTERAVLLLRTVGSIASRAGVCRRASAEVARRCGLIPEVHAVPASLVPRTSSGKLKRRAARERFLRWRADGGIGT